jgi:hypothetical protein
VGRLVVDRPHRHDGVERRAHHAGSLDFADASLETNRASRAHRSVGVDGSLERARHASTGRSASRIADAHGISAHIAPATRTLSCGYRRANIARLGLAARRSRPPERPVQRRRFQGPGGRLVRYTHGRTPPPWDLRCPPSLEQAAHPSPSMSLGGSNSPCSRCWQRWRRTRTRSNTPCTQSKTAHSDDTTRRHPRLLDCCAARVRGFTRAVDLWVRPDHSRPAGARYVRDLAQRGGSWGAGGGYYVQTESDPALGQTAYVLYRLADGMRAVFRPTGLRSPVDAAGIGFVTSTEILFDAQGYLWRVDPSMLQFS